MDLHYSQTDGELTIFIDSFTTLWIYTILKLKRANNLKNAGFTTLWIYTILKPKDAVLYNRVRFTTLWIYTILKLRIKATGCR